MKNRTARMVICIAMLIIISSCAYAQSYTTYVESSNIGKSEIAKTSVIWIIADTGNFMWNRTIESTLFDRFKANGIKTLLTTDYVDICDLKEEEYEKILTLYLESESDYMLAAEIGDLYTYSAGGGIKNMDINASLLDFANERIILKMALSTEADTNDWKSLNETRRPAIESMAESFTKEFMKYVK